MDQLIIPWPEAATWRRWAFYTAVTLISLYLAWLVRELWVPLGLAFILATVLDPVVDRMELRGWNRTRATAFIFFGFIVIVGGLLWLAAPAVFGQVTHVQQEFTKYFPDTSPKGLQEAFTKLNLPSALSSLGVKAFETAQAGVTRSSTWLTQYGMSFLSNLIWVVIVPIVAFYALRDYHLILGKALLLVPRNRRKLAEAYVGEVSGVFAKYLRGLAIVSGLNGLATWLLLWALGVPSALVLGIVAGILYSVPYIGAIMTVVLTAAIAFVGGGVPLLIKAVVASMILHQIVFDQAISPRILGGQVGLHPILSIIALLSGNLLLGIIGMILAVPIAACIQIGVLALVPKLRVPVENSVGGEKSIQDMTTDIKGRQQETDTASTVHEGLKLATENVSRAQEFDT